MSARIILVLLATSVITFAAEDPKPKQFEAMDYGSFLSASFHNAEDKNVLQTKSGPVANKGIAIKLGEKGDSCMLFDTELMRMAGGWTGGWLKLRGVAFDGGHGPNPMPPPGFKPFFYTNSGPGWSRGDSFADPRPVPTGPGAAKDPLGPLPRDWAKYRGLHVNGKRVVLAYSVGAAEMLELPALETAGDQTFLTRTFQVTTPGDASTLLAAEGPEGSTATEQGGVVTLAADPKKPETRLLVTAVGAPAGAKWETAPGGRIHLRLPAFTGRETFKIIYWSGPEADVAKFADAVKGVSALSNLREVAAAGSARWGQPVETVGTLGKEDAASSYVVDTLTVPFDNPQKSWMRLTGLDFFSDGRIAVSTWSGDVWIVSGVDARLEKLQWKRHAAGLFQPLGLKIVEDKVYVLGRDQITRLHDRNSDDEADFYENFNNDVQVTPNFHEFALDLHTDPAGNFYFAKGGPVNPGGRGWGPLSDHNGCILRVSKDGTKLDIFATGVRAPNGMGVSPKGEVTIADNQGTWVPACYIHMVKPGGFVSVVDLAHRTPNPETHDPHLCYLPMDVDNSSGAQVWVTSDKWGPFTGKLLHLSYGKSSLLGTVSESVNGMIQGGTFRFPVKFDSGICRARFSGKDGQLYVAGLKGWQTNAAKDGTLQRMRYTGKTVCLPSELQITDKGVTIGFTAPVDRVTAADAENYSVEQWNYLWSKEYGSSDYKPGSPTGTKGRDPVEVKSVRLSSDLRSVFLEIPGLKPVHQMQIKLNIKAEDGTPLPDKITNTINTVGKSSVASVQ